MFFKKKSGKKSYVSLSTPMCFDNGYNVKSSLAVAKSIIYYQNCAPVYAAIQLVTEEVSSVQPYLYNTDTSEYVYKTPVIDLLNRPNAFCTLSEFMKQIAAYFLITGNCFIKATGDVNKPPKELIVISPANVILQEGYDGFTQTITVSDGHESQTFERVETKNGFRYIANDDAEIMHIKEYNPRSNSLWGMSKLLPIHYEIEQYIAASIHNLSLLKKGTTPSGAFTTDNSLSDDQVERLREQINNFFSGALNAGRPLLLESGLDFKALGTSNKDMDFMELKRAITNTIYTTLKIPLPLISGDFATYSNMETAKLNLYDNAVLPLLDNLYKELSLFLLPRYNTKPNLKIHYSAEEIPALSTRVFEETAQLKASGVLTINELRARIGYEPLTGGDVIYGTAALTPIADDTNTTDEPKTPSPKTVNTRLEYIAYMKAQKNRDGSRKYSEDYIRQLATQYGFVD